MASIPAATLRAWEKRYGIPAPRRTTSRYRLYSDEDVAEIAWVKARVEEGVPPRQAAHLALERRQVALAAAAPTDAPALSADLKAATLAYDEDAVHEITRRAAAVMAPHQVLRDVMMPAIASIGRDWEAGLVTVSQEHFASQLVRRFAHRLMDLYQTRTGAPPVVCACAPGEQHEIGLLAVAIELRRRSHPVVYLGPSVPVDSALSTAEELRARVLVVSTTQEDHLEEWGQARDRVIRLSDLSRPTIVWGGPAAGTAARLGLPGPRAATVDQAVEEVVRLS
jgi:methanogenic corrinoid protein MtbC1